MDGGRHWTVDELWDLTIEVTGVAETCLAKASTCAAKPPLISVQPYIHILFLEGVEQLLAAGALVDRGSARAAVPNIRCLFERVLEIAYVGQLIKDGASPKSILREVSVHAKVEREALLKELGEVSPTGSSSLDQRAAHSREQTQRHGRAKKGATWKSLDLRAKSQRVGQPDLYQYYKYMCQIVHPNAMWARDYFSFGPEGARFKLQPDSARDYGAILMLPLFGVSLLSYTAKLLPFGEVARLDDLAERATRMLKEISEDDERLS